MNIYKNIKYTIQAIPSTVTIFPPTNYAELSDTINCLHYSVKSGL